MSVYLDASVLVSLFITDLHTSRARSFLVSKSPRLIVSNFASAEFASALNRRVRMQELVEDHAVSAFTHLDSWIGQGAQWVETTPLDIQQAQSVLRRLDLPLRTPDALNIVVAARLNAELATFDERMAECGRRLGLPVVGL